MWYLRENTDPWEAELRLSRHCDPPIKTRLHSELLPVKPSQVIAFYCLLYCVTIIPPGQLWNLNCILLLQLNLCLQVKFTVFCSGAGCSNRRGNKFPVVNNWSDPLRWSPQKLVVKGLDRKKTFLWSKSVLLHSKYPLDRCARSQAGSPGSSSKSALVCVGYTRRSCSSSSTQR